MDDVMTAQRIREIRLKYGMSQKAFSHVLGIGSATMARYEAGDPPTKAMANLIRAAENPEFMRDCLERDGSGLSSKQQERSKQLVYGLCTIKEEEGEMKLDIEPDLRNHPAPGDTERKGRRDCRQPLPPHAKSRRCRRRHGRSHA